MTIMWREIHGHRRPRAVAILTAAVAMMIGGCLTRTNNPPLPYVKPAQSVPQQDQAKLHLAARLQEIDQEIARLHGIVERLQAEGDPSAALRNLEQRVALIERQLGIEPPAPASEFTPAPSQEQTAPPVPPAQPAPPANQPPAPPAVQQPAPQQHAPDQRVEIRNKPLPTDEQSYRRAYALVRSGSTSEALPLLREFVTQYPKSRYVPDALYWIGDALFEEGRYDEAVLQFDRVVKEHPGSKKELSALLKLGQSFAKMGDPQSSRIIYEKLLKEHPHSAQARHAKTLLKELE